MPTLKSKRDLILKSSVAAAPVADLTVSMEALFTTAMPGTIRFQDASDTDVEEKTKYLLTFFDAGGGELGSMTLKLVGNVEPTASTVTVTKPVARSDFDPRPRIGTVALLDQPEASYERVWKVMAKDGSGADVADNVAKLDVRVLAEGAASVSQTVRIQGDNQLVLAYAWTGAGGTASATGSVTLTTSAAAGSGYRLGAIRIVDNDPTSGEELRTRVRPRRTTEPQ